MKGAHLFKHGLAYRLDNGKRNPIYLAWVNMRNRCRNKKSQDYKYYGARGISICPQWEDFMSFHGDMSPSWETGLTLDRIDVNKGYSPQNCKWSTRREQSNNRTYNRLVEYKGKSQSCGKWVKELGLKTSAKNLYKRIFLRGWSVERALV